MKRGTSETARALGYAFSFALWCFVGMAAAAGLAGWIVGIACALATLIAIVSSSISYTMAMEPRSGSVDPSPWEGKMPEGKRPGKH